MAQTIQADNDTRLCQRHSQATAAMTDSPVLASSVPIPRGDINQQALTLVQCFYSQVHGSGSVTPHPRELDHAASLIGRHGWAFAVYFVTFACKAACQNCFSPHVFGGLLRYEASALAAYRHQQSQQARRRAERAETRQAYLRAQYEKQRSARIVAYRDTLTPEDLEALKHEVQTRLEAESAGIPRAAFEAWVNVELQEQLATLAEVPPFDVWLVQREATGLAADNPAPGCTPAGGARRYAKPVRHNPPGAYPQTDVTAPGVTLHPATAKGPAS